MSAMVWKYQIEVDDSAVIRMPLGARLLHVGEQYGRLCVWALLDRNAALVSRLILIRGTGHVAPDAPYVGCAVTAGGDLVWHVFDGGEQP